MRIRSYVLPVLSAGFTITSLYVMFRLAKFSSLKEEAFKVAPVATEQPAPEAPPLFGEMARRRPIPPGVGGNVDKAETAASAHPTDPKAQKTLGLCYYASGTYELAAKTLEKAVALAPESSKADGEARVYLAYAYLGSGAYDKALPLLEALKPGDLPTARAYSDACFERGSVYYQLKKDDTRAAAAFTEAQKAAPNPDAALALGTLAAAKKDTERAHAAFTTASQALPAGPKRAIAFACLGRLASEAGKPADAQSWYAKALKDDPENVWARTHAKP